jgi:hypothetical protein
MPEIIRVSKLPAVQKAPTPKKQALRLHLEHGYAPSTACRKAKVTDSFRHSDLWKAACAEFHAGTQVLKAEPAAADPEIDALLKEIDSRSPQAIAPPVDRSPVSDELMSTATPQKPPKPVDDANLTADQRSARLAATLARLDAEAEERARKREANPHTVTIPRPEDEEGYRRPSLLAVIRQGELMADQVKQKRYYDEYQAKHYRQGVGGFDLEPWMLKNMPDVDHVSSTGVFVHTSSPNSRARLQQFLETSE